MSAPLRGAPLALVLMAIVCPAARAKTAAPIHFTASSSPAAAHPGEVVTVTVTAKIDHGWHVYSVVPTPAGPAATEISSFGTWAPAGPTQEDTPIRRLDPNFGKEVGYHEGAAVFSRAFRVPANATTGPTPVTVHYQTCNSTICLPPADAPLTARVAVASGPVRAQYAQASSPNPPRVNAGQTAPPRSRPAAGLVLFLLAALYCFWGLTGRHISPYVGAFLPPPGYGGVSAASEGLPWLSNYDSALAQARAEGKLLLIDFTGYTCTNCRLNEKNVFPHPQVQAEFANYVRVQLYTDGGTDGPRNQKLQQDKFGDVALPLYGVINPQTGAVVDKAEGVQSVSGFTRFLASHARPSVVIGAAPPPRDVLQAPASAAVR